MHIMLLEKVCQVIQPGYHSNISPLTGAFIARNDELIINVDFIKKDNKNIRHTRLLHSLVCI